MAIRLRHVGVVVSNLDKALDIYINYLGYKLVNKYKNLSGEYQSKLVGIDNIEMDVAILKSRDNARLELLEYKNLPGAKREPVLSNDIGSSHFAITVKDIDNLYKNRENFEVEFMSKPLKSPDNFVKVAYVIIMNECIVELVQVFDEKAKYSGGE